MNKTNDRISPDVIAVDIEKIICHIVLRLRYSSKNR